MRVRLSWFQAAILAGACLAASILALGFRPPAFVDPEPVRLEDPIPEEGGAQSFALDENRVRGALGLAPTPKLAPDGPRNKPDRATGSAPLVKDPAGEGRRTDGKAEPGDTGGPGKREEAFRVVGCYEEGGELRYFLKGSLSGRFIPVAAITLAEVLADRVGVLSEGPGFSLVAEEEP